MNLLWFLLWLNLPLSFGILVVTAFAGAISIFQINTYQADKRKLNTFWGIVGGVLLAFTAVNAMMMIKLYA